MEIAQRFTVPYPRDAVWACFHDTAAIVACLPGAALSAEPQDGQLKLAMTIKLGPIVATFAGDGLMALDEAAYRGSVSGMGIDRKSASRVKGEAAFALDASVPGETTVDVKVDYTIAGALAQFSRGGIVIELATRLTEAFAGNLKKRLDEQASLSALDSDNVAANQSPVPSEGDGSDHDVVPGDNAALIASDALQSGATEATAAATRATSAPEPAPATSSPRPAVPPPVAPLNLGNLFWKILWDRVRNLFGFGRKTS
jgi:carbon monoxide dehydrogenase subunit G